MAASQSTLRPCPGQFQKRFRPLPPRHSGLAKDTCPLHRAQHPGFSPLPATAVSWHLDPVGLSDAVRETQPDRQVDPPSLSNP